MPAKKYIKYFSGTTGINSSKYNGMPEENIENITKSDRNFAATFVNHHVFPNINFNGHCLIKNNFSIPKKVIKLYLSYILNPWLRNPNRNFTLNNCLFGSVELIQNVIQINTNIVATAYDLVFVQNFHLQIELILAHLCILIIKIKMS